MSNPSPGSHVAAGLCCMPIEKLIQVVLCKQAKSTCKLHACPPGGTTVDVVETIVVYNCCVTNACMVDLWLTHALTTWRVSMQNGSPMRKP